MYTMFGGFLIAIMGMMSVAAGIMAGRIYVKHKQAKDSQNQTPK